MTYAYWRLWVGVSMSDVHAINMSEISYDVLDELEEGPRECHGLEIESIYMQGQRIGIGIEVLELQWTYELGEENIFDVGKVAEAQALIPGLKKVFDDIGLLGLEEKVLIRHHIDLGG